MPKLAAGWLALLFALLPASAGATTLSELQVGVRVIGFLANPPAGPTEVAILFDGQNKASFDDAQTIYRWMGQISTAGRIELVPVLRDLRRTGDPGDKERVAFLASGTTSYYSTVFEHARHAGTLLMSADMGCVLADKCAVGVTSAPRIEVVISRDAARDCHIAFSEAFRMMVTER